jgi:predicted O-methyltransferase YrrM
MLETGMWKLFLFRIRAWVLFYIKAKTRYNIQSVYQHTFVEKVLENRDRFYCFEAIEKSRKACLKEHQNIHVIDHGAGQAFQKASATTTVKAIAATSLSPPRKCEILFHLARHLKAKQILELGTSLGISTAYMASADSKSEVHTLEGNPEIASRAKTVFQENALKNIRLITGPFKETLDDVLSDVPEFDLVFVDGHHAKEPTLLYVEKTMAKCHSNAVIVVDDIHWSKDMEEAWCILQKHPRVFLTIDIFYMGFIFLNPALSKEHIRFVPYWMKPWNTGLFGK